MIKTTVLAAALLASASSAVATDDYTIELYDLYCSSCHGVGVSGAPAAFSEEWRSRVEQGMDTLVNHAIQGVGNMPAMGTCAECTEDDIRDLIRYMAKEQ